MIKTIWSNYIALWIGMQRSDHWLFFLMLHVSLVGMLALSIICVALYSFAGTFLGTLIGATLMTIVFCMHKAISDMENAVLGEMAIEAEQDAEARGEKPVPWAGAVERI